MSSPETLHAPSLELAGLVHGFTTRQGGHSDGPFASANFSHKWPEDHGHVAANFAALAAGAGFDLSRFYQPTQVHAAAGARVTDQAPTDVRRIEADYLYTDTPGVTVGVITADCVPVLLAAADGRAVAAIHAGWRGLVAGVIEAAAGSLAQLGVAPEELRAGLGPCIGPCCFEVGPEVAAAFDDRFGADAGLARLPKPDAPRPHVDLWRAAKLALARAGLEPDHVSEPPACTHCTPDRFFSYRRDGACIGQQLSFIGRRSA